MILDGVEQFAGLAESSETLFAPGLATWQPKLSGSMDLVIDANGRWIHEGSEITRPRLVNLFTRIMRREGDEYFLLTPVEKWQIQVVDYPLWISLVERLGDAIRIVLSCGYSFILEASHNPRFEAESVVLDIAPNWQAKCHRNAYYDLVNLMVEQGEHYLLPSVTGLIKVAAVES